MGNKGRICVGVTPSPIYLESIVFIYRYITNILKHKFNNRQRRKMMGDDIFVHYEYKGKSECGMHGVTPLTAANIPVMKERC